MTLKSVKLLVLIFVFCACHKAQTTQKIESERLAIGQSLESDTKIDAFLKPYRERLEASMNEVLCYSAEEHKKTDGELNTAVGNLMADAVFERCAPILKKRYNLDLDLVLLNHGGIRAPLPKGPIYMKTPYNIMPFENKVVIVQMKSTALMELVDYLRKAQRAHPVSGIKLAITRKGRLKHCLFKGKTLSPTQFITSLQMITSTKGGDRMDFFQNSEAVFDIDYKIRNVLIDYFTIKDTLNPKRDNRFVYTN